jgi:thymidine kinase
MEKDMPENVHVVLCITQTDASPSAPITSIAARTFYLSGVDETPQNYFSCRVDKRSYEGNFRQNQEDSIIQVLKRSHELPWPIAMFQFSKWMLSLHNRNPDKRLQFWGDKMVAVALNRMREHYLSLVSKGDVLICAPSNQRKLGELGDLIFKIDHDLGSLEFFAGFRYSEYRDHYSRKYAHIFKESKDTNAMEQCKCQVEFIQEMTRVVPMCGDKGFHHTCVLYTGPMYAGKTEMLIKHLRHVSNNTPGGEDSLLVVKHANDVVRFGEPLKSRSGLEWSRGVKAINDLDDLFDSSTGDALEGISLVAIDEAQFFEPDQLVALIKECIARKISVVISALSALADTKPWPSIAAIQPFVTRTTHLRARCSDCHGIDQATLTFRQKPQKTPKPLPPSRVYVASPQEEANVYKPLCLACYVNRTE